MAEVEPMQIDGVEQVKPTIDEPCPKKKQLKRKRVDLCLLSPNPEEKQAKIATFRSEIISLVKLCKELVFANRGELIENVGRVGNSLNSVIACLMEESDLPLSKLVDEVFERVKGVSGVGDGVSKASVKSAVLIVGQRLCYGVISADADVLEDEDECALWCWETRDLKLMPTLLRASLKVRRTCRKKIQERIMAVSAMINALESSEDRPSCVQELMKASEKLSKVLNEADIRLAEKVAKREELQLIKQMEKNKREKEREKKRMDRELLKEKLQSEKELRRLHDEAEKEERRREKEENEIQKQQKRQQEEAEKELRRKEKEEAELRKSLALQKQASLMERFLKRNKTNSLSEKDSPMNKATTSGSSLNMPEEIAESVSLAMDSVLAQNDGAEVREIWSSHLNAWRCKGRLMQSNGKMRWGIRQMPKTELVKELKLTANKELYFHGDLNEEKLSVGCVESNADRQLSHMNTDDNPLPCSKKSIRARKLLQFDKSYRPAFYGVWPKESRVVGGRHPFVKDPDIDYEIDSDEEWEEDEPGESLSDCDKDDEEQSIEDHAKDDDEDESEDGFFVPDGYLSENEGVNSDDMDSDDTVENLKNPSNSEQQIQSEEFCALLRQQKYLSNITEHALKKNQPLIILNLMHEKTTLLSADECTGTHKLERMCLQALSIRRLPGLPEIDISVHGDGVDEENDAFCDKSVATPPVTSAAILESDLPQIISIIQSNPVSIDKLGISLKNKFPAVSKSHLKNKVREISEFSDNRWQVKKEVLSKYGLSRSPEKTRLKTKSIASFLKRCLPPSGITKSLSETSPQSSQKNVAIGEQHQDCFFVVWWACVKFKESEYGKGNQTGSGASDEKRHETAYTKIIEREIIIGRKSPRCQLISRTTVRMRTCSYSESTRPMIMRILCGQIKL
ncbi:chromatin assembly factor 1 [Striga asiatica]|uniref:Chromatin assembly factor 1 n=1 Tax=Striga asiatica TaxID=4170 RepID=A0A5A7P6A4_STRAF|nr:chromatin assembly factor 1 [Striga asiatica]